MGPQDQGTTQPPDHDTGAPQDGGTRGPRYTPETEALLAQHDQEVEIGRGSFLRRASLMLQLAERDDIDADGGPKVVLNRRYENRLSPETLSTCWTIAWYLVRHLGVDTLLASASLDSETFYAMARRAKDLAQGHGVTGRDAALKAFEEFSALNRTQAREKLASSRPQLDTPPAPSANVTPSGHYPQATVDRYESGVMEMHHKYETVERDAGQRETSVAQTLEFLGEAFTAITERAVAALKRLAESGATGEVGDALLTTYLLAEQGCEAAALKAFGEWLHLSHEQRTLDALATIAARHLEARANGPLQDLPGEAAD